MSSFLRNDTLRLCIVTLIVFALHGICLIPFFSDTPTPKKPPNKKLAIRTVQLSQPKPAPQKKQRRATASAKEKKPAAKKTKRKKPVKKQSAPQKKALYSKLKKQLSSVEAPTQKKAEALTPLPRIATPKMRALSESETTKETGEYIATLGTFFQQHLELPEIGEVTVKITLSDDGTVKNVEIVSYKSPKNVSYLQNRLPSLRCPSFSESNRSGREETFEITFQNIL